MLKLFFDLKYQNITLTNPGVTVASDSKNYLVAKFNTISDDWEIPLSAVFVSTVDKVAYTVLVGQSANLAADECFVPWEVLRDSGEVYVSVFSGNLHTTNVAKFAVVKSGYIEGEIPPPPTPTVYEQILEELGNKQDVIHLDNAVDVEFNPNGHYVLYYFDTQEIRHNIFDFEVFQELAEGKIYEILDSTLQGDPNIAPSLYVAANQGGSYSLVYMDSDDNLHTIFDFSNLPLGSSDYNELENIPAVIAANSPTGWGVTLPFKGTFVLQGLYYTLRNNNIELRIKDNVISYDMLLDAFKKEIFKDYGYYSNPPADLFTNYSSAPVKNGIWEIYDITLQGLPIAHPGYLIQFYCSSQRIQFYVTVPATEQGEVIGEERLFMRVQKGGDLGVWQELTRQKIVSGVVNQNGTITFANSDGTTFTTTGSSVIGEDGFSPTATVTQTQSGATVSITDKNGTTTANISNGNDYVLTAQDKSDIADIVLSELPTTQGVQYGNASN